MKFKYLKGSEKDFKGADDDFLLKVGFNPSRLQLFKKGCYTVFGETLLVTHNLDGSGESAYTLPRQASIIAQREPIPESPRESWRCRCVDTPILKEKLGHGLDCDECNNESFERIMQNINENLEISRNKLTSVKLNATNNTGREITASKYKEGDDVIIDVIIKDIHNSGPINIIKNTSYLTSNGINNTITTRGNQYGEFKSGGEIMQNLKQVMRETPNWNKLNPSQREALEMIQHKIGRILNGNPDYDDNWRDIAGYAQLILNDITGEGTK